MSNIFYLGAIGSRNNFGHMLNDMNLKGEAVEIGTHRGDFAKELMNHWQGKLLNCIDPWSIPMGYEEQSKLLWESTSREDDFRFTRSLLNKHGSRVKLIRACSEEAVKNFITNSLDFIYIDGDHRYEMIKKDLLLWLPKLKMHGVLAGHDIICPNEISGGWGPGIQRALYDVLPNHLPIYLIPEPDGFPWSFYIIKK